MKSDKNFRLAKTTKTMMALLPFRDQEDRNGFKRGMVQAQLAAEAAAKASLKSKKSSAEDLT